MNFLASRKDFLRKVCKSNEEKKDFEIEVLRCGTFTAKIEKKKKVAKIENHNEDRHIYMK